MSLARNQYNPKFILLMFFPKPKYSKTNIVVSLSVSLISLFVNIFFFTFKLGPEIYSRIPGYLDGFSNLDRKICKFVLAVCYWPFISQSGGFQIWISNLDIKICKGVSGLILTVYKSI